MVEKNDREVRLWIPFSGLEPALEAASGIMHGKCGGTAGCFDREVLAAHCEKCMGSAVLRMVVCRLRVGLPRIDWEVLKIDKTERLAGQFRRNDREVRRVLHPVREVRSVSVAVLVLFVVSMKGSKALIPRP